VLGPEQGSSCQTCTRWAFPGDHFPGFVGILHPPPLELRHPHTLSYTLEGRQRNQRPSNKGTETLLPFGIWAISFGIFQVCTLRRSPLSLRPVNAWGMPYCFFDTKLRRPRRGRVEVSLTEKLIVQVYG
jgi:hypothetical protein